MAGAARTGNARDSGATAGQEGDERIIFIIRAVGQHAHEDIDFKVRPTTLLARIAERVAQRCGVPLECVQLLHETTDIPMRVIYSSTDPSLSDATVSGVHLSEGDVVSCQLKAQADPPVNARFVVAVHEEQQWRQITWACEPCQAQQPLQQLMAQVKQRADVVKPGIRLMALRGGTPVNDSDSPASLGLHAGQFIVLIDIQQVLHNHTLSSTPAPALLQVRLPSPPVEAPVLLSLLATITPTDGNVTLGRHLLTGCLSSPQLGSLGMLVGVARTWLQQGFSGGKQQQVQWEEAELTHGLVNFVEGLLQLGRRAGQALGQCEAAGNEALGWLVKLLQKDGPWWTQLVASRPAPRWLRAAGDSAPCAKLATAWITRLGERVAELWGKDCWRYRQLWAAASEAFSQARCKALMHSAMVLTPAGDSKGDRNMVWRLLLAAKGRRGSCHQRVLLLRKQLAAVARAKAQGSTTPAAAAAAAAAAALFEKHLRQQLQQARASLRSALQHGELMACAVMSSGEVYSMLDTNIRSCVSQKPEFHNILRGHVGLDESQQSTASLRLNVIMGMGLLITLMRVVEDAVALCCSAAGYGALREMLAGDLTGLLLDGINWHCSAMEANLIQSQAGSTDAHSDAVLTSVERGLLERMTGALYHLFAACGSTVPQQALQQAMQHGRMAQLVKFAISSRQEVGPQVVAHVIATMATCGQVQQAFLPDIRASNAQGWLYQLLTDYLGVLGTSREGSWQQQRHADSQAAVRGIKDLDTACRSAAAAAATLLLALGGDARAAALELLPQVAEAVPLLCPDDRPTTACWLAAHTAALKHAHGNAMRKTAGAEDAQRLAGLVETYAQAVLQVLRQRWLPPQPGSPLGRFITCLVEVGSSGGARTSGSGAKGKRGAAVPVWLARSGQLLADIMECLDGLSVWAELRQQAAQQGLCRAPPSRTMPWPCCAGCGTRQVRRFKVCGGCHVTRYCSAQCQEEHWGQHRQQCSTLTSSSKA